MKKSKTYLIIVAVTLFLLLIPFVGMQFSSEINWSLFDFIVAAFLLISTGVLLAFILQNVKTIKVRILLIIVLVVILLLLWAELAVGVFGTPISGS